MNDATSKIHLELLDKSRRELLVKIAANFPDYVLGGGTALALQILHRQSFDLDFFGDKPIPKNLLEKLSKMVKVGKVLVDSIDELTILTDEEVKVSFISYPFEKMFAETIQFDKLKLFSLPAIAASKAYTIGRRGVFRDYFDLYAILSGKLMNLDGIIKKAQDVYGEVFSDKLFLSQLVYFDDLTDMVIEPIGSAGRVKHITAAKKYLEETVESYLDGTSNG